MTKSRAAKGLSPKEVPPTAADQQPKHVVPNDRPVVETPLAIVNPTTGLPIMMLSMEEEPPRSVGIPFARIARANDASEVAWPIGPVPPVLPSCLICGKTVEEGEHDRTTCSACRSFTGKVGELDITIRTKGKLPSRAKAEWKTIRHLLRKRFGFGLKMRKLWERCTDWLVADIDVEAEIYLRWPLKKLIECLRSNPLAAAESQNSKGLSAPSHAAEEIEVGGAPDSDSSAQPIKAFMSFKRVVFRGEEHRFTESQARLLDHLYELTATHGQHWVPVRDLIEVTHNPKGLADRWIAGERKPTLSGLFKRQRKALDAIVERDAACRSIRFRAKVELAQSDIEDEE